MASYKRWLVAVTVGVSAIVALPGLDAQNNEFTNNFKYISGQDIQPVFEGWSRKPDGSFVMHNETYLLEAKWENSPIGAAHLHTFE